MRSIFGWSYPPGCNGPPDEDEYSCAICGVTIRRRQMYCGVSCLLADESGAVDGDWTDYVEDWPIVLAKSKGEMEK